MVRLLAIFRCFFYLSSVLCKNIFGSLFSKFFQIFFFQIICWNFKAILNNSADRGLAIHIQIIYASSPCLLVILVIYELVWNTYCILNKLSRIFFGRYTQSRYRFSLWFSDVDTCTYMYLRENSRVKKIQEWRWNLKKFRYTANYSLRPRSS